MNRKNNMEEITTAEKESRDPSCEESKESFEPKQKKGTFKTLRAALICLLAFTVICGLIYPLSVGVFAQIAFPYEANGSQVVVTMADGTQKIYGSELIGQAFENPKYLLGRVNGNAPSNLSPESEEYEMLLKERIVEREQKLADIGYSDSQEIPHELLSSSGSGVDPHISPETAYFQIPVITAARNKGVAEAEKMITEETVKEIIDEYTQERFIGIFGERRVNVLLVNLALDGLI